MENNENNVLAAAWAKLNDGEQKEGVVVYLTGPLDREKEKIEIKELAAMGGIFMDKEPNGLQAGRKH